MVLHERELAAKPVQINKTRFPLSINCPGGLLFYKIYDALSSTGMYFYARGSFVDGERMDRNDKVLRGRANLSARDRAINSSGFSSDT